MPHGIESTEVIPLNRAGTRAYSPFHRSPHEPRRSLPSISSPSAFTTAILAAIISTVSMFITSIAGAIYVCLFIVFIYFIVYESDFLLNNLFAINDVDTLLQLLYAAALEVVDYG